MAALLPSFLTDFCESFHTTFILLTLVQKVRKSYLHLKCHQMKSFHPRTLFFHQQVRYIYYRDGVIVLFTPVTFIRVYCMYCSIGCFAKAQYHERRERDTWNHSPIGVEESGNVFLVSSFFSYWKEDYYPIHQMQMVYAGPLGCVENRQNEEIREPFEFCPLSS